jgi:hypothetical protein
VLSEAQKNAALHNQNPLPLGGSGYAKQRLGLCQAGGRPDSVWMSLPYQSRKGSQENPDLKFNGGYSLLQTRV